MKHTRTDSSFPRREFLRGTAAAAGTALVAPKLLSLGFTGGTASVDVAFWNGSKWQPATKLPSGDPSLSAVQVTVRSQGELANLARFEASFAVQVDGSMSERRFVAWRPSSATARFTMPVRPEQGLVFVATLSQNGSETQVPVRLGFAKPGGPLLREGIYLIAPELPALNRLEASAHEDGSPELLLDGAPATFGHLLIEIERA